LPVGVRKSGKKYRADIKFLLNMTTEISVNLKSCSDAGTASRVFQSVYANRATITKELEKMTDRKKMIAYVKSYISLD
jgi:hypothetical protein